MHFGLLFVFPIRMVLNNMIARLSDSNKTQLQQDRQRYNTMTSESIIRTLLEALIFVFM